MASVNWNGTDRQVVARMALYGQKCHEAVLAICNYISPLIETYAKENASWEDQTGNARQGLRSFVEEVSHEIVRIYLAHGVEYGIWLEVRFAGRYAIIWESLQAHFETITKMLKAIFQ